MTQTTAPAARKVFRVLGRTDDVTECEHCGRTDLKGTIVLMPLDEDGNDEGDPTYFGAVCGARAAGWTTREIRSAANKAQREQDEAERIERERAYDAESARLELLRFTDECPLYPEICRVLRRDRWKRDRSIDHCPVHS